MRKIAAIKFRFVFEEADDSKRRLLMAYARIFELARKRMVVDSLSSPKYSERNESRRISDSGRTGRETKSKGDNNLSNVSVRKAASDKVWTSVAYKQQIDRGIIEREGN